MKSISSAGAPANRCVFTSTIFVARHNLLEMPAPVVFRCCTDVKNSFCCRDGLLSEVCSGTHESVLKAHIGGRYGSVFKVDCKQTVKKHITGE